MNVYISDTHFGHENIIRYCERPFRSVAEMDAVMLQGLREAEAEGHALFHLGDVALYLPALVGRGWLRSRERATLVVGNHDRLPKHVAAYEACFGAIVGTARRWRTNTLLVVDEVNGQAVRVLLSHDPQRDLGDADFSLYGHHHNNIQRMPERYPRSEWGWLLDSERHFNVGAELLGYRPRSLAWLLESRQAGEPLR
jgi:calcineurin-like phosphoesterase family protein